MSGGLVLPSERKSRLENIVESHDKCFSAGE